MENRLIRYYLLLFILSANSIHSFAQKSGLPFSINEINHLIELVDTVSSQNNNYHVWFQQESCDTSKLVTHIWINEKLGDRTFKDSGISICVFYPYKKGYVFIYMLQKMI